jgi:hypothetical protein
VENRLKTQSSQLTEIADEGEFMQGHAMSTLQERHLSTISFRSLPAFSTYNDLHLQLAHYRLSMT